MIQPHPERIEPEPTEQFSPVSLGEVAQEGQIDPNVFEQFSPHEPNPAKSEWLRRTAARWGPPVLATAIALTGAGAKGGWGSDSGSTSATRSCTPHSRSEARGSAVKAVKGGGFTPQRKTTGIELLSCRESKGDPVSYRTAGFVASIGGTASCVVSIRATMKENNAPSWTVYGLGNKYTNEKNAGLFNKMGSPTGEEVLNAAKKSYLAKFIVQKCAS
ncbi:MAG TPA: hypothetical protein VLH38_01360 [Patescibacteria group bacterium]|nr:hypothetical protein [Patescibacteria group bacterium]